MELVNDEYHWMSPIRTIKSGNTVYTLLNAYYGVLPFKNDFYLVTTNAETGTVNWAKKIINGKASFSSLAIANNRLYVAGSFASDDAVNRGFNMLLMCLDITGNVLWNKRYSAAFELVQRGENASLFVAENELLLARVGFSPTSSAFRLTKDFGFRACIFTISVSFEGQYNWGRLMAMNEYAGRYAEFWGGDVDLQPISTSGYQLVVGCDRRIRKQQDAFSPVNDFSELFITRFSIDGSTNAAGRYMIPDVSNNAVYANQLLYNKNFRCRKLEDGTFFVHADGYRNDTSQPFCKTYFIHYDSAFKVIDAFYLEGAGKDFNDPYYTVEITGQGTIYVARRFDGGTTATVLTIQGGNILQEQKINPVLLSTNISGLGVLAADDENNFVFTRGNTANGKPLLEFYNRPSGMGAVCGDTAVTYTALKKTGIYSAPMIWDTIMPVAFTTHDWKGSTADAVYDFTETCSSISICDQLRINMPDTVCNNATLTITATKNDLCVSPVSIQFFPEYKLQLLNESVKDAVHSFTYKIIDTGIVKVAAKLLNCENSYTKTLVIAPQKTWGLPFNDTIACSGKRVTVQAPEGFSNYQWQGSINTRGIDIDQPGTYQLRAYDYCNQRLVTDSVIVKHDSAVIAGIQDMYELCMADTLKLTFPPRLYSGIIWSDGTTASNFSTVQPGNFNVQVVTQNHCSNSQKFSVTKVKCNVFIPGSFTPNADGLNDFFSPAVSGKPTSYRFTVWNRYGEQIFESNQVYKKWDGTISGVKQPPGNYVWRCSYIFPGQKMQHVSGTVVLLR